VGLVSAIFRNILGKPGAADFRDSAEHFVSVLREQGIALTFARDELRYADDLAVRLAGHNEYRDALGCWLGEVLVRNFGGQWVVGHALGPAIGWQCRRSLPIVERLRATGREPAIRERTGLPLDPYFSAGKMAWLLEHSDAVQGAQARHHDGLRRR